MNTSLVFQKCSDFYKSLYADLGRIAKRDRYTCGQQCEKLTIEALSLSAKASYLPKNEKRLAVRELSFTIDLLKVFLRLGNELRIIDYKHYLARESQLLEIGRMTGGWLKSCM